MSLSFFFISFSVSFDCHASSQDICSFSAILQGSGDESNHFVVNRRLFDATHVRFVVVSSWLSVIFSKLAFVSRNLSSISSLSRSFS